MFCMNCGAQLPEGAKFCFKCGTDMKQFFAEDNKEKSDISLKAETIQDTPGKETVTLNIGNWKVEYPESIKTYIESYSFYADLAGNESRKFEQYYKNAGISSLEDVLDKGASIFATQIQAILEVSFNRLLKFGVDTLTPSMYLDIIFTYSNPDEVFQPFQKSADAIIEFASRLADMRDAERMMRGKWVGGGFGIKGAIKGAIKAGVMNMGTNALRGIGDTITNASDKAKLNKIRAAAFPTDTSKQLSNGMFDFVLAIHDAEMSVLVQNGLVAKITFDATKEKIQLTNRIHSVSGENLESLYQAAVAALHADPFDLDVYKEIYSVAMVASQVSSENANIVHDLFAFSEFFGMLEYCKKIFAKIDVGITQKFLDDLTKHPDTVEQEFTNYVEKVQMLKKQNPYYDIEAAISAGTQRRDQIAKGYEELCQSQELEKQFKAQYEELMALRRAGNLELLWTRALEGDGLAEYVLTEFYVKEVFKRPITAGNKTEFEELLGVIKGKKDNRQQYTRYLVAALTRRMYSMDHRDYHLDAERAENARLEILKIADDKLGCSSARAWRREDTKNLKYISDLQFAALKFQPTGMAKYGSILMEGSILPKNTIQGKTYIQCAAFVGDDDGIRLAKKYHIMYDTFKEGSSNAGKNGGWVRQNCFTQSSGKIRLTRLPNLLAARYEDLFRTASNDIVMAADGLNPDTKIVWARDALKIPPDEKVFFIISGNTFGGFKKNMNGLAIGERGLYANGGFLSFKGAMSWESFRKAEILCSGNTLQIGSISLVTTGTGRMVVTFFGDLKKICEADLNSDLAPVTGGDSGMVTMPPITMDRVDEGPVPDVASPMLLQTSNTVQVSDIQEGIICPSCGKTNKPGKKFCSGCGSPLGVETKCPHCGKDLKPGKKFCSGCGAKIE